jgi:hypothetical protein
MSALVDFEKRHPELQPQPEIESPVQNLLRALAVAAQEGDAIMYSSLVQLLLTRIGLKIPPGVFTLDIATARNAGRPPSSLRWKALREYLRDDNRSDGQIARLLVPDSFKKDPKKAADRIRSLRKSAQKTLSEWLSQGRRGRHDEEVRAFLDSLTDDAGRD